MRSSRIIRIRDRFSNSAKWVGQTKWNPMISVFAVVGASGVGFVASSFSSDANGCETTRAILQNQKPFLASSGEEAALAAYEATVRVALAEKANNPDLRREMAYLAIFNLNRAQIIGRSYRDATSANLVRYPSEAELFSPAYLNDLAKKIDRTAEKNTGLMIGSYDYQIMSHERYFERCNSFDSKSRFLGLLSVVLSMISVFLIWTKERVARRAK